MFLGRWERRDGMCRERKRMCRNGHYTGKGKLFSLRYHGSELTVLHIVKQRGVARCCKSGMLSTDDVNDVRHG